ncbi:uncharacterized protein SPSK_05723 [Sporothrix schenckii 1099-18]|uniref:Uncharacterized protein n=1 Tax=Sporothrix schenckii 1099-18 TaxID=1397361 RepID=A0A0F2LTH5_SPOSC|nr:uncharacterized protein SPSK_05723 [Sporothrix schenckii 1099-18]KJR80782.1 hypothetical protein SPSK_05723 [Sporothrix schenckii 1099-18]
MFRKAKGKCAVAIQHLCSICAVCCQGTRKEPFAPLPPAVFATTFCGHTRLAVLGPFPFRAPSFLLQQPLFSFNRIDPRYQSSSTAYCVHNSGLCAFGWRAR